MDHDGGYHLLFSHARMVADVLRGFVGEAWVDDLDLDSLERVNARFHADGLDRRDGDVLWRLKRRDGADAFLYLLLEFQSTADPWMAVRILVYVGLLYLHLIRERQVSPGMPLPPVFPVVIYNGNTPWRAALDIESLIRANPEGRPWPWRPRMRYHLLDGQRYTGSADGGNLVAVLFEMEQCRTPAELERRVQQALTLLHGPAEASLRRAVARWLSTVLAPARGIEIRPEMAADLSEVRDMLAERVKEWQRQWRDQGLTEGLKKGLEEGRAKGRVEGRAEGRSQGEAAALIRIAERKFGPLPDLVVDRIRAADANTIEAWLDRFVVARSLDEMFDASPHS